MSFLVAVMQPRVDNANSNNWNTVREQEHHKEAFFTNTEQDTYTFVSLLLLTMADKAAAATAVQDAGNGEAKVSKNALKKQVRCACLPAWAGCNPCFFLPAFFFSTIYGRKCKDRLYMNMNTQTVFMFSDNMAQSLRLKLSLMASRCLVSLLCPIPVPTVVQFLQAKCNPLVAADCRPLARIAGQK